MATAANGNSLIVFESGGPDLTLFAVIDQQGNFITQPDILTDNEPDSVLAAVFGDGSFAAIHTEDDSTAATMNIISNDGVMQPAQDFISPITPLDSGRLSSIVTSAVSFTLFYEGYANESGFLYTEVYKNRLTVSEQSAERVSVTNESRHTVDVIISAIGKP